MVAPNMLSYKTYVRQIAGVITGTVELSLEVLASENHSLFHCSVSLLGGRLQFSLSQFWAPGRSWPLRARSMSCLFEANDPMLQLTDTFLLCMESRGCIF